MSQELFKNYACNQGNHYEKYYGAARPSFHLKLKYPLPFPVSLRLTLYTAVQIQNCLKSTSVTNYEKTDNFR